jgi:hypothetical protein
LENGVKTEVGKGGGSETDTLLGEYRTQFSEYVDNSKDERTDAELARDYFDGKQWTAPEAETLKARGQPVITDNKIKDKVEYMEGVERKTRSDPKAFPRTPVHEEDADVATDSIRYVFDKNNFAQIKSAVFQNLLIEGFGGCEVIVDKKDPRKVLINKIRWDRIYRDPFSMETDCSDAMYRGVITWMDVAKAKGKWQAKATVLDTTMTQSRAGGSGETQDDKPRWADSKRNRVQIFEHYEHRDGVIMRSVFCWGGFLEEPAECPYLDDEGEHEDPMILASAYIGRDGKRYGYVSNYISRQDEVNKRRSKSLHLLNTAQIIYEDGAVEDVNKARTEVHKPDGVIKTTPGLKFEIQRNLDLSAAHFQMLQQAEASLAATGPNAALVGNSGALSGRAKELDQQGGAVQIGVLFDAIRDWQLRVARAVWNRIRQYWDGEMWIRVTDDERGLRFVPINRPLTQGDLLAKQLKGQPPEQIQAQIQKIAQDPQAQLPALDERGQPKLQNAVAQLDVDIILDEVPDVINVQAEEFDKLVRLAESGKVPIPPDVLIEASQLRNKKQLMDKMSGANDPMAAQMAQMQQAMQQLAVALQEATVRETEASATLKLAQAGKAEADAVAAQVGAATSMAQATSPQEQKSPNKAAN